MIRGKENNQLKAPSNVISTTDSSKKGQSTKPEPISSKKSNELMPPPKFPMTSKPSDPTVVKKSESSSNEKKLQ